MSQRIELDHVGVAIRDLDSGREAYTRLGFALTKRSIHRGSPSPGAPVIPFGSGNHCAMFRDGYLEVVGLTDASIYSNIKALVARYEGAHIVAFGVESADESCATLSGRGVAVEGVRRLERDAAYGPRDEETRKAAFRNLYFDQTAYPEARLIFIEHLTRDVLWQPHLLDHPNGVVALRDVFLCTADAAPAVEKYARLLGSPAHAIADDEWRIALARGSVWIVTPAAWERRASGAATPPLPSAAGIGFTVRDLAATHSVLTSNGLVAHDMHDGAIWIAPEHACGVAILFYQEERSAQ